MVGSLNKLEKAIKPIKDNYDFIIIDTPPNLGFLSMNAFMISNFVLTPMAADSFSLKAVRLLAKTLAQFKDDINKDIPVIGILLTKYSFNTNIAKILEDSINKSAELLNTKPFESRIRNSVKVLESQLLKTDLLTYAPRATASEDYSNFIDEFLERIESWA